MVAARLLGFEANRTFDHYNLSGAPKVLMDGAATVLFGDDHNRLPYSALAMAAFTSSINFRRSSDCCGCPTGNSSASVRRFLHASRRSGAAAINLASLSKR